MYLSLKCDTLIENVFCLPLSLCVPLPQDEECAHQLQFEFNREERNRSRDVTQTTAFPRPFSQPTVSIVW